jgi:hypothetical protein
MNEIAVVARLLADVADLAFRDERGAGGSFPNRPLSYERPAEVVLTAQRMRTPPG